MVKLKGLHVIKVDKNIKWERNFFNAFSLKIKFINFNLLIYLENKKKIYYYDRYI